MIHTNLKIQDEKIVCLMLSGAVLSQGTRNLLLENAVWMRMENKHQIQIKHSMCCGVLESDLIIQNYLGVGSVKFSAMLNQRHGNGYTNVSFIVRLVDLEEFPKNENWFKSVEPPPEIKEAISGILAEIIEREFGEDVDAQEAAKEAVAEGTFFKAEQEGEAEVDPSLN